MTHSMPRTPARRKWVPAVTVAAMAWGFAWALVPAALADESFDPVGIFLTWQQDPTTTMTIDWHTVPDDGERPTRVQYKLPDSDTWQEAEGDSHPFPHSDRTIHRVEVTGLEPGTDYQFRFGEDSKVYRFRTMPADNQEPIRFVVGGDLTAGGRFADMNRVAMQHDPDFILWGGDLAYVNGLPQAVGTWHRWFDVIKETLIDDDGRVVPILCAIGNHEILFRGTLVNRYRRAVASADQEGGAESRDDLLASVRPGMSEQEQDEQVDAYMAARNLANNNATYFYDLFAFSERPGYGVLDFGSYLSLILLNTEHGTGADIAGPQTDWLRQTLSERAGRFTHILPIYHVPAFPGVRSYNGKASQRVREHWVPLFEQHGVRVAFENHDHAYKRTVPIREEAEHPEGIVYIGDGAWGVNLRKVHDVEETWYLARAESARHVVVVTLQGEHHDYQVVGSDGELIDRYTPQLEPEAVGTGAAE